MAANNDRWVSSSGLTIEIEPFFSKGYGFKSLHLQESIGGSVASGVAELYSDTSQTAADLITKCKTIEKIVVKNKDGASLTIKNALILSISPATDNVIIHFECSPTPEWKYNKNMAVFQNPDEAFSHLYPGRRDIRCQSDSSCKTKIWQQRSSDYECLKRLAASYKANTIYAFGLEGFLLKDLIGIDSDGNKEPARTLYGGSEENPITRNSFNYDHKLYLNSEDAYDEKKEDLITSKYWKARIIDGHYSIVAADYDELNQNYLRNTNLMASTFYGILVTQHPYSLPGYKLGDVVYYKKREDPKSGAIQKKFLVGEMKYDFSLSDGVYVTSTLRALEEDGVVMNQKDKVKKTTDSTI